MDKFTDQYFTYRETPVDYDGVGNITRIKGNTLVWNQMACGGGRFMLGNNDYASPYTTNGVTFEYTNDYTVRVHGTPTGRAYVFANQTSSQRPSVNPGDVLLLRCGTLPTGVNISSSLYDGNTWLSTGPSASNKYFTIPSATPTTGYNLPNTIIDVTASLTGTAVDFTVSVNLFNLTKMFGSGNEPTEAEFNELYPSYYPYDSGSLLSFMGTGIKTTGFNQFDEQTELGGYSNSTGEKIANTGQIRSVNAIRVFPNEVYYVKCSDPIYLYKYGVGMTFQGYWGTTVQNQTITIPSNCYYLTVGFRGAYGTTYKDDLCINISNASKNGTYEPYQSSTTDLPVLAYFPTGMKSAGSVYDELTPNKAITRIGSVDLGSLTFSDNGAITGGRQFITSIPNKAYGQTNIVSAKFIVSTSTNNLWTMRGRDNSSNVTFNVPYTTREEMQSAMSGVYLYYELSAESEQDINISMFYPVYADGTEQILPTSDTSPFFGDIEYYNGTEGETNIRKFWLINGENERWDLTEKEFKAFLNNPQGLGFRKTVESVRYGERQNKVSETYNFPQPQGELLFYDSYNSTRYDKYNKFIRFLMNQPITLYYMIPVSYISGIANIYTLDCEVTEVQKTESKTDNILRSSIVFNGMEFYKGDPITVNGTGTSYTLTNEGDFPVGFEITIEGNLTNPYVTLSQDGELYGEAKFDSSTAFNSVYVNSNDGEQNVILEQGGAVIPNPLSYQDLSISNGSIYVTFVKLARGESELSIGSESGTVSSVKIEFTPKYRSV